MKRVGSEDDSDFSDLNSEEHEYETLEGDQSNGKKVLRIKKKGYKDHEKANLVRNPSETNDHTHHTLNKKHKEKLKSLNNKIQNHHLPEIEQQKVSRVLSPIAVPGQANFEKDQDFVRERSISRNLDASPFSLTERNLSRDILETISLAQSEQEKNQEEVKKKKQHHKKKKSEETVPTFEPIGDFHIPRNEVGEKGGHFESKEDDSDHYDESSPREKEGKKKKKKHEKKQAKEETVETTNGGVEVKWIKEPSFPSSLPPHGKHIKTKRSKVSPLGHLVDESPPSSATSRGSSNKVSPAPFDTPNPHFSPTTVNMDRGTPDQKIRQCSEPIISLNVVSQNRSHSIHSIMESPIVLPTFTKSIISNEQYEMVRFVQGAIPKLVCTSSDGSIQAFSIKDGQNVGTLRGHTDRILALAVSNTFFTMNPDDHNKKVAKTIVASGSVDEGLKIWDLDSSSCLHSIHAHKSPIWSVAVTVNPSGDVYVLSSSTDGVIKTWNAISGKKMHSFKGHTDRVLTTFIFDPDGDYPLLVSAGADKTVRVWDLVNGEQLRLFEGHTDEVYSVTAESFMGFHSLLPLKKDIKPEKIINHPVFNSTDAKPPMNPTKTVTVVSAGRDTAIRVWDVKSGCLLFTFSGHTKSVLCISLFRIPLDVPEKLTEIFPTRSPFVVSCSEDGTVKLWNLTNGKLLKSYKWHKGSVRSLDVGYFKIPEDPNKPDLRLVDTPLLMSLGLDKTILIHNLLDLIESASKDGSFCVVS